jgi:hypothetical protein
MRPKGTPDFIDTPNYRQHRYQRHTFSNVSFIILLSNGPQAIVLTVIPCFPSLTANTLLR